MENNILDIIVHQQNPILHYHIYVQFGVAVGAGRKQHALACQLWIHWNTSCGCCTSHRLCTWRWQVKDWLMFNQTASDICVLTLTPHQVMSGKVQGFAACLKKLPADTCVTTRYAHTPACYLTHQHTPSSPIQAWQIKSNLKLLAQWKCASPPWNQPHTFILSSQCSPLIHLPIHICINYQRVWTCTFTHH